MYGGIWDDITGFLDNFGITGASALAVTQAVAAPTLANIQRVQAAFAAEGTSAPPELMDALWSRYYEAIRQNPAASSGAITAALSTYLPWMLGGGLVLFFLSKRRK